MREGLKLSSPTVADVVRLLLTFPQDAPFVIKDPDTCWRADILYLNEYMGDIYMTAEHCEMTSSWKKQT